jgi:hypothetical protein
MGLAASRRLRVAKSFGAKFAVGSAAELALRRDFPWWPLPLGTAVCRNCPPGWRACSYPLCPWLGNACSSSQSGVRRPRLWWAGNTVLARGTRPAIQLPLLPQPPANRSQSTTARLCSITRVARRGLPQKQHGLPPNAPAVPAPALGRRQHDLDLLATTPPKPGDLPLLPPFGR